jgi:hypothetical protein
VAGAFFEAGDEGRRLGAALHAELGEQVRDVVLDRLLGEEQLGRDLTVRKTFADQIEDLALAKSQIGERAGFAFAQPAHGEADGRRVEELRPSRDRPDRFHDAVATHLLEQVARRAREAGVDERLVVGERREDQAPDLGPVRTDVAAHFDSRTVAEPHVDHDDIR